MTRARPVTFAIALASALALVPAHAVQRAFVASYGSDANTATNCGFANPCRGFAAAVTVVDPNGEVLALDSAGYGAVTLTQSVSLTAAPGIYAGVASSGGTTGVTIATPNVSVTLRGLTINSQGGSVGVSMTNGLRLSIENCIISNFSIPGSIGVLVNAAATVRIIDSLIRDNDKGIVVQGGATVDISGSKVVGNATTGLLVSGQMASSLTSVSVTDSVFAKNNAAIHAMETVASALDRVIVIRSSITHNTYGLRSQFSGGPTVISVSESLISGNTTPLSQEGAGATLESFGNNTLRNNGPVVGTVSAVSLS